MAATIQTIEKPTRARALDTSGNNNHGQIYSGRALEFDGSTDYLTYTSTEELEEFTAVGWINCYGDTGVIQNIWDGNAGGTYPAIYNGTPKISWYAPVVNWMQSGKVIEYNTWYRVVFVFKRNGSAADYRVYINGIEDTGGDFPATGAGTYTNGKFDGIGSIGQGTTRFFNGMMSDMQVWNTSWTADDVTYDYLNPEQLALNRGGTSLTNSNLKLWYPMNDGHRGQQSYILDASNTGLGDELLTTTDLTTIGNQTITAGTTLNGWTHHATYQYDSVTASSDGIRIVSNGSNDLGSAYQSFHTNPFVLTAGKTYRLEYSFTVHSGAFALNVMNNPVGSSAGINRNGITGTENNTVKYFTASSNADASNYIEIYSSSTNAFDATISYISLKPVNNKNHATTVFHGDEMVQGDDKDMDTVGNWTGGGGASVSGGYDSGDTDHDKTLRIQAGSTSTDRAELAQSNLSETTAAGRSYLVEFDYKYINTTDMSSNAYTTIGGTILTDTLDRTTIGTWTQYKQIAVAINDSTVIRIYVNGSSGHADNELLIDNFSIKEIGTASGWTDADQQLDIPQTALQSYNQFAWFDGYASDTAAELDSTFYFEVGQTINMWVFPNSISIYDSIFGARETENYMRYQKNSGSFVSTNELVQFEPDNNTPYSITATTSGTLEIGKWKMYTFIWNADRTIDFYINGEKKGDSTATADTTDGKRLKVGHFGAGYGTSSLPFEGAMTEISHYTDILTQAEINDLYNDGKAKSALDASGSGGLSLYLRNNGLSEWKDLKGSNDANVDSAETMLITAGADATRDSQGFLMNRQKLTNSLNLHDVTEVGGMHVVVPNNPTLQFGSGGSIAFWIKPIGTPGSAGYCILNNGAGGSRNARITLESNNKIKLFWEIADGTNKDTLADSALTTDIWTYVTCTWDGTTNKIYYNNALDTSESESGTPDTDTADLYIGIDQTLTDGHFEGFIDDLVMYNDTLTLEEVKRNYNAGKRSHR